MTLTYLTEKEKLDTLLYMSENMLSDSEEFQASQLRFIEVFLERFTKEMSEMYFHGFSIKEEKDVYYISWIKDHRPFIYDENRMRQYTGEDYYEKCIRTFNDCVDKYHAIYEMLKKIMSNLRYTTSLQRDYLIHFYKYNFVLWDRDLEYLKGVVKRAFPRYSENGRAKLSEYYDPSRYLWSDPMDYNSYTVCGIVENEIISNKLQWRSKKKHDKNEQAAINYYDKGLKRLNDEEKMLRRILEKEPNSFDALMDLNIFVSCKSEFLGILINLEDEDLVLDENPFGGLEQYFMQEYTQDFIKHYENMGRFDIVNWMMMK